MTVVVSEIIDSNIALGTSKGEVLYAYLESAISKGEHVVLDFIGIEMMTTAFLNVAIGQLYHKFKPEELNNSLSVSNLQEEDVALFKKVISRAKDYFRDQEAFNKKMNERYEDE